MIFYIVCEDQLSEAVMRKMVKDSLTDLELEFISIGKKGRGFIKSRINDFNNQSNNLPFFVLADLDTDSCVPGLKERWLKRPCRDNLIFRIAIREVEAWLLADDRGFSQFLNLDPAYIRKEVDFPDMVMNPKEKLIFLVERSRKKELKKDIVRKENTVFKQGPGYNTRLTEYVLNYWDIERASVRSDSLKRALKAIQNRWFIR